MSSPSDIRSAKQAIADDKWDDCSAAFVGLGVYSYYTGMKNLRKQETAIMQGPTKYKMGSRRLGIATISASLIGLGVWRAFN
ncbi:hypothetical protein PEBR_17970 [Penicillium brasilianum]|uniref:Uncharacterized protein n=1 Tax=Penicillium brasilianum TaxID=104259 RepID=A0A1S9RPA5_PENBI|nr:hypothetical protein PEBR_17970 [Penicillium brasilianum]